MSATHSHRPTTKVTHKPFKSRKASKGQLRDRAKGILNSPKSPAGYQYKSTFAYTLRSRPN